MHEVSRLRHVDHAGLDCGRLEEILLTYGEAGAERFLGRTLEDVAVRLNRLERAWRRNDAKLLARGALDLAQVAESIGLVSLGHAARNVGTTATSGDPVAQSATVCRMIRVGEASLMRIWDIRDETV